MKIGTIMTLCARECPACPEFEVVGPDQVAVYDNQRPGERAVFSRADIRKIRDAAVTGRLEQFC